MNDKFYVSYKVARLLKEKGYDEVCDTAYDNERIIGKPPTKCNNTKLAALSFVFGDDCYSAPTKAEAIDWLESKGMTIDVHWIRFNENRRWNYSIFNSTCDIIDSKYIYSTRLEAEEAAIIKACELLTNEN